jgi:TatD DNase family protein
MGKNNKKKSNIIPAETYLRLPPLADASLADQPIIDTHTHLVSTFSTYRSKYKNGTLYTIHDFVREMYRDRNVKAIVDVWCEAPVLMAWRELADSALTVEDREQKWGGVDYWFVMGELSNYALSSIPSLRDDSDRRSPVCIGSDVSYGSELISNPPRHDAKSYNDAVEASMYVTAFPYCPDDLIRVFLALKRWPTHDA